MAVDYRYLEEPPRQAWLEQLARRRLPKNERHNAARLVEEVQKLRQERDELHRRLAALCGIELPRWQARACQVQGRVERISADARRRLIEGSPLPSCRTRQAGEGQGVRALPRDGASWADRFSAALHEIFEPARDAVPETVTVAEELAGHVLAEDIPAAAADEIQKHAGQYPGTRIVSLIRRAYPAGAFAAQCAGYLGRPRHTDHAPRDGNHHAERGEYVEYRLVEGAASSNTRQCFAESPESAAK